MSCDAVGEGIACSPAFVRARRWRAVLLAGALVASVHEDPPSRSRARRSQRRADATPLAAAPAPPPPHETAAPDQAPADAASRLHRRRDVRDVPHRLRHVHQRDQARTGERSAYARGRRRAAKPATVPARRTPTIPRRSSRGSSTRFPPRPSPTPARPATTGRRMPCGKAASTKRATSSCVSCHSIHQPKSTTAQLKAVNQQQHVHHLPSRQGGEARSIGPHAGARGQDGVHLVPQPARLDQRAAAEGRQLDQRVVRVLPHREARAVPVRARRHQRRQLRDVPRSARLEQRSHAGREAAVPLPAVSQPHAPSVDDLRQQGRCRAATACTAAAA